MDPLHDQLQGAMARAQACGAELAVLVMHLDRLQDVHEALGRRAGATLLREVEERWWAVLDKRTRLATLDGGGYAVLVPGAGADTASTMAEQLLGALEPPFEVRGALVQIEGAIGVAVYPEHGTDAETLMRHADIAASEGKRSPAGYALYAAKEEHPCTERLQLAAELRRAIDQGQLVLHYQPQVDVRSGELTAVEALVRWDHPARGLLSPGEFIPLAEQLRLIGALDSYVVRAALEQSRLWTCRQFNIRVGVNLSVHDLQEVDLPDRLAGLLARYAIAPERLCIEITESALLADPCQARQILGRLRGLGIRTAIDDFGTGYSSLAYLKDLPLDELKIDRSFVKDMASDAGARAIVRCVIDLAHDFGLQAIAEGVEDRATQQVLASLGCDIAQGYYFSPPLNADDLLDWANRDVDSGLDRTEKAAADARHRQLNRKRRIRLRAEEEFLARKQAEEALRLSEARYRAVVNNIREVIFQVDAQKCWAFLNPAWEELTGFSCDETIGCVSLDFVHPDDREIPFDAFQGIRAGTSESCRFEIRLRTRTNDFRWVEAFATTVLDPDGGMIGAYGILSDMSARFEAGRENRPLILSLSKGHPEPVED